MGSKRRPVECPHCGHDTKLVDGTIIYPHRRDLARKRFWLCQPCNAYVGCHRGTATPLGKPANAAERLWRGRAHAAFDPLWKSGSMSRNDAYAWLCDEMGLPKRHCHIAMMTVEQCKDVIAACNGRAGHKEDAA